MKDVVRQAIDRIYLANDHALYRDRCGSTADLPAELPAQLRDASISLTEHHAGQHWPSWRWDMRLHRVVKGEFDAWFNSTLQLSKLARVYYLEHEFEIANCDDKRMDSKLHGFTGQPYTQAQFNLAERVAAVLTPAGYQPLTLAEMAEVIPELTFIPGVKIFGPQVTVEYALFHDLLRLYVSDRTNMSLVATQHRIG